ncbi:MAG: hypothetical protein ABJZ55_02100 [Fuerstiella sp.]
MVAVSNKTKIDARLKDAFLAKAIRDVGRLPPDSPIRTRLKKRNLPCNMSGIVTWLIDDERAAMLVGEMFE